MINSAGLLVHDIQSDQSREEYDIQDNYSHQVVSHLLHFLLILQHWADIWLCHTNKILSLKLPDYNEFALIFQTQSVCI